VATALAHRCEAFLTNDARLKRVAEIRVLTLEELRNAS
jgi:predicted nucleic acid-binding protein